ncbi:MAG: type II secretion system protein [Candidatus Pacebacteria bacterium]|nr:type II secretion system protein [Candidatus Paceibacterota bacterium]
MPTNKKGFTLIELLVVIAIIGILAGVVLVSLSGARTSAKDARIISNMEQIRNLAEIHYAKSDSYGGQRICNDSDSEFGPLRKDIRDNGGNIRSCVVSASGQEYCMKVKLNDGSYWCIDHKMTSKKYTSSDTSLACDNVNDNYRIYCE